MTTMTISVDFPDGPREVEAEYMFSEDPLNFMRPTPPRVRHISPLEPMAMLGWRFIHKIEGGWRAVPDRS